MKEDKELRQTEKRLYFQLDTHTKVEVMLEDVVVFTDDVIQSMNSLFPLFVWVPVFNTLCINSSKPLQSM